jgi:hypothetical protein
MSESLFVPEADGTWRPTDTARGPWTPDALHGGPVAALLARVGQTLTDDLQPVRLTVEITRPVPIAPLTVTATLTRPGRRVRAVSVSMTAGGNEVATASMLAIRVADVPAPEQPSVEPPPGPEHGVAPSFTSGGDYLAFHNTGVEHRFVRGNLDIPGPATDWIRLRVPVVPDEPITPLDRVCAAADFGNGVSRIIDFEKLLFINPDLTIYLHRLPAGEWVCVDAVSRIEPHGIGLAMSDLYDERGPIGQSLQSLVIDTR